MEPRFEILAEKKLVGKKQIMTYADNRTYELWKSFMPERRKIINTLSTDLFSIQVYNEDFDFKTFNPQLSFEKWAAAEVTDFDLIPDNMEPFTLKSGLYAVFIHRGPASDGPITFRYIFGEWLPASNYIIDNRPHFEILGQRYKNDSPDSEEEVWIPVKPR